MSDRTAAGSALFELIPRQLHAHRLRVAVARELGTVVHAAADERDASYHSRWVWSQLNGFAGSYQGPRRELVDAQLTRLT